MLLNEKVVYKEQLQQSKIGFEDRMKDLQTEIADLKKQVDYIGNIERFFGNIKELQKNLETTIKNQEILEQQYKQVSLENGIIKDEHNLIDLKLQHAINFQPLMFKFE